MRSPTVALLIALLPGLPGAATSARAQEPLLLHIRPNTAPLPEGAGSGESLSDAEIAARAAAMREAVWQRAERRARIAIASVCTGCLRAAPPAEPAGPARSGPAPIREAEASPSDPRPRTEGDL